MGLVGTAATSEERGRGDKQVDKAAGCFALAETCPTLERGKSFECQRREGGMGGTNGKGGSQEDLQLEREERDVES